MYDALCELFLEPLECDRNLRYTPDTVTLYYENRLVAKVVKVDSQKTIQEITAEKL